MPLMRMLARVFAPEHDQDLQTKKSAVGTLISMQGHGQPVWTPRDYTALAKEGFASNAVVYRCVRMISEAAASVPLLLYENGEQYTDHPLLKILKQPNPGQGGADLLEAWYGYLLVAGNAYLEAVSVGSDLRELYVLRPDRMKLIAGPNGWPTAYEYSANGQKIHFQQEGNDAVKPILHMAMFHPTNDHYGMSPIEAAATAIDIHNAAGGWNKALLDNAARPSGALVYNVKDGNMTTEQFVRLKEELEESYQGARNAGRPLLLEGGLDWKAMGLTPRDMDFIEAKYIAAREIALALGVPPMLLGIPGDNTYSNYMEANRTFWRQTILPLAERTAKALSAWLEPAFGAELELKIDLNKINALSSERETMWERVRKADFLTLNEKRKMVGYDEIEGGDTLASSQQF